LTIKILLNGGHALGRLAYRILAFLEHLLPATPKAPIVRG